MQLLKTQIIFEVKKGIISSALITVQESTSGHTAHIRHKSRHQRVVILVCLQKLAHVHPLSFQGISGGSWDFSLSRLR